MDSISEFQRIEQKKAAFKQLFFVRKSDEQ
jgi:hypothetical protein